MKVICVSITSKYFVDNLFRRNRRQYVNCAQTCHIWQDNPLSKTGPYVNGACVKSVGLDIKGALNNQYAVAYTIQSLCLPVCLSVSYYPPSPLYFICSFTLSSPLSPVLFTPSTPQSPPSLPAAAHNRLMLHCKMEFASSARSLPLFQHLGL